MATIQARKGKKGVSYTVTVRLRGHKQQTATFRRKKDAQDWADRTATELRDQTHTDPRDMKITLQDALDDYRAKVSPRKAATTQNREKISAAALVRGLGAGTYLPNIRPKTCAEYRDERLKTVSAYSVHQEFALLSHLYETARKEWGLLGLRNPVKNIFQPKIPRGRQRFLTDEQCRDLLWSCALRRDRRLYYYVLLLLHSGMRPGEASGIRWTQVDLEARTIHLPKTKNSDPRTVPMTATAAAGLAELKKIGLGRGLVFTRLPEDVVEKRITTGDGIMRESWKKARIEAGLPGLHLHDLRHTAATHLIRAGVEVRILAEICGWRVLQMAMRYTHDLSEAAIAAIATIEKLGQ